MSKKISQRQARWLRAELNRVQQERRELFRRFGAGTPGTFLFRTKDPHETVEMGISTARKLGYAVVATLGDNELNYWAVH